MKNSKKKRINYKEWMKKPLFVVTASILSLILLLSLSLIISKPGIVKGEYSIQSIVDMLLNHEERISNLETKTDETQTEVNQTAEDVKRLQESTETTPAESVTAVSTPVTRVPAPTQTPDSTDPEPVAPAIDTWTNSHGTFKLSDVGTVLPMYFGKEISLKFSYSSGTTCPQFRVGQTIVAPVGTKIVRNQYGNKVGTTPYAIDLTDLHNKICPNDIIYFYYEYPVVGTEKWLSWLSQYQVWW